MKQIFLLLKALFSVLSKGSYKTIPVNPKKILVVQLQKLGDMICTTPVFAALKKEYPESIIVVLSGAANKDVVQYNKDVTTFISWRSDEELRQRIQKENFDVAVLIGPSFDALALLIRSQVTTIIAPTVTGGYSPWETRGYKLLKQFVITVPHRLNFYAPQEYLNLLKPLGIVSTDTRKHIFFSEDDKRVAEALVSEKKGLLVALFPSAGNKIKEWGVKNFAEVADALIEKEKATLFLCGGPSDKEKGDEVLSFMRNKDLVLNTVGNLSINELAAFLSRVKLCIGVDTGPLYIAEALRIPTIDIIGPMSESEQPPVGEKHKIVYLKERKGPELHIMNARVYNASEARRQIESITPKMVLEAFKELHLN